MDMDAQYARALRIGRTPQGFALLKQAALGQNDDFDQIVANMALKQLTKTKTAVQGAQAQQQLAQNGKQTVSGRILAEADQALPEMSGIGRLPAPGMETLAAAQGGIMSYADGGAVGYAGGGALPEGYEWFEDPTSGEVYPRKKMGMLQEYAQRLQQRAQGIKPPAPVPDVAAPQAAAPTTPAGIAPVKAPQAVKSALANVSQPKAPVADPTEAQKSNLDKTLADTEKLYDFLDKKFGDQLSPIKDQLQRDREEYKNMKSENVGLALLGAAGAVLKPGRSTAAAVGEGLSALGEYGAKFQPQLLAARQGISAGEVGLAQAQAQAARGNFATAAQLTGQEENRALEERKLAMQEKYYGKMGDYYAGRGASSGAGTGLGQIKALQSSLQAQLKALQGRVDPESKAQAALIQQQLVQISQRLAAGAGLDLTTGFVGGKDVGGNAIRSSLFEH